MKIQATFVVSVLGLFVAACGGPSDAAPVYAAQTWGVSQCNGSMPPPSCVEEDTGVPDAGSGGTSQPGPLVTEPAFNGGFDARFPGRCILSPEGTWTCSDKCYSQPDGSVACESVDSMPTGWALSAPRTLSEWNGGILDLYANGRTYSTPHPNHPTLSSNSALSFRECNEYVQHDRFGCALPISIVSPRFTVSAGATYRLSYWFIASRSWGVEPMRVGLVVNVHWYAASGAFITVAGHPAEPDVTPPSTVPRMDWAETGRTVVAPTGAVYGEVQVMAGQLNRQLRVDDVRLIPL